MVKPNESTSPIEKIRKEIRLNSKHIASVEAALMSIAGKYEKHKKVLSKATDEIMKLAAPMKDKVAEYQIFTDKIKKINTISNEKVKDKVDSLSISVEIMNRRIKLNSETISEAFSKELTKLNIMIVVTSFLAIFSITALTFSALQHYNII